MYLIQCVNAYIACTQLMDKECDYLTAYALTRLKKALQPHAEFYAKKEMELAKEFGVKDENGNLKLKEKGTFTFADPARADEFNKKKTELGSVEIDEEIMARKMKPPASIKPAQLEALEGFVIFEGEEE
jgi:hypothetical protein